MVRNELLWFAPCVLLMLQCTSAEHYDYVVIGGGLMGSATAWQLALQGKQVLLLEKQDSVYREGSSLGDARIARSSNRGNDIWSYLHNRSVEEARALVQFLQDSHAQGTYHLDSIYTTSPVTYLGKSSIYEQLVSSLIRQNVDYEIARSPVEARAVFSANLPAGAIMQKEYNKHSGTINPQRLIHYLHQATRQAGGHIRYRQKVESLSRDNKTFSIQISDGQSGGQYYLSSRHLVSAAGPYTGTLLSNVAPYFSELITPQRVFLAFFTPTAEAYARLRDDQKLKLKDAYPVINSLAPTRDSIFFSMIEKYTRDGRPVIKIGGHFQRTDISNLDEVWHQDLTPDEINWGTHATLSYMQLIDVPLEADDFTVEDGYSCVYSLTESEIPIVSYVPSANGEPDKQFVVLCGMSGVGAKGAMTYGLIASDLLLDNNRVDSLYGVVKDALGFERLQSDMQNLESN